MIIRGASYNGVDLDNTVPHLSQHTALIVVGQSCDTSACGQLDFRTSTSQGEVGALKVFGMHPRRSDQGTMQITTLRTYVPGTTDGGSNSIEGSFALINPLGQWLVGEHYYVGGFSYDLAGTLDPFDTEDKLRGVVMEASSKPVGQVPALVYGMGPAFQAIDNPNGPVGWRWLIAGYNTRADALPYAGITGYDHGTLPGRLLVADGTVAFPSLSFMSGEVLGERYGFYKPDATSIGVSLNGVDRQQFRATGYFMRGSGGVQERVVGPRDTGWPTSGNMTGTSNKTSAFATSTVTTALLAQRVKAIEEALKAHGLIGP
jgi:hypothetical protein